MDFRSAFEIVRFYIARAALDELTKYAGITPSGSLAIPDMGAPDAMMHTLARAMLPALENSAQVNQLYVDYMSLAFPAHLVRHYSGPNPDRRRVRAGLSPWQARAAEELIAERLDGKVSVLELAAECNFSQSHFARAFVQTFGMPPHRWLLERRVERAKALIDSGSVSLNEIATRCGFASQSHFNRVFLTVTGTTPSRWRRTTARLGGSADL